MKVVPKAAGFCYRESLEGIIANHSPSLCLHVCSLRYNSRFLLDAAHHSSQTVYLLHLNLSARNQCPLLHNYTDPHNTHHVGLLLHIVSFPNFICQILLMNVLRSSSETTLQTCTLISEASVSVGELGPLFAVLTEEYKLIKYRQYP